MAKFSEHAVASPHAQIKYLNKDYINTTHQLNLLLLLHLKLSSQCEDILFQIVIVITSQVTT